jgi:Flp pilus assembly protein TadD
LILKRPQEARADLNAALLELNSRIQPDRPDLTLIADRGLALALLGSKTLARRDLEQLKASTLSKSAYIILSSEIEAPGH